MKGVNREVQGSDSGLYFGVYFSLFFMRNAEIYSIGSGGLERRERYQL
jgi:hypothetical protein